jgi:hypothetical protein
VQDEVEERRRPVQPQQGRDLGEVVGGDPDADALVDPVGPAQVGGPQGQRQQGKEADDDPVAESK